MCCQVAFKRLVNNPLWKLSEQEKRCDNEEIEVGDEVEEEKLEVN